MKIKVVSQQWYRENGWGKYPAPLYDRPECAFWRENNFITIRHSTEPNPYCAVPADGENILKLQFDDAVEDPDRTLKLFDRGIAETIRRFVLNADRSRMLFINCGAGISRSGAVGEVLNDYFNKFLECNRDDDEHFRRTNRQIQGNPLVRQILRDTLFDLKTDMFREG